MRETHRRKTRAASLSQSDGAAPFHKHSASPDLTENALHLGNLTEKTLRLSAGAGSSGDVTRQWRQLAAVPSLQGVYVAAFSTGGTNIDAAHDRRDDCSGLTGCFFFFFFFGSFQSGASM